MRKTRFITLLLFLLSGSLMARELIIDVPDIFPFGFVGKDGKVTGMVCELGTKIAQTAGFSSKSTLIPYARTILDLRSGEADFVIRYSNQELSEVAIPVSKIVGFPSIIIGRKETQFKSLNDLHGKTVGVIRGAIFDERFEKDKKIFKFEVKDYEQNFKMLLIGRVDAIIGSTIGLYSSAHEMKIDKRLLGPPLYLHKEYFILHFSKKNAKPEIIAALKKAVHTLNSNGEIQKIVKKYEESMLVFHMVDLPFIIASKQQQSWY